MLSVVKCARKDKRLSKVWKSWASKNAGYESMNQRSQIKFSGTFTRQFAIRETRKIYVRDSFRLMVTVVDRYLKGKEQKRSITRNRARV